MSRKPSVPGRSAEELENALKKHGVTVDEVVGTINDIRKNATSFNKSGEEVPDRSTRLKASQLLLQLMQLKVSAPIEGGSKELTPDKVSEILGS